MPKKNQKLLREILTEDVETTIIVGKPPTSGLFKQKGGTTYDLDEFYGVFMETRDPTCYQFAKIILVAVPLYERWAEFQRLCNNTWFSNYIQRWLVELEVKMRSEAIQRIKEGCDTKDFARYKWLAEGKAFNPGKVGRPTSAEAKHSQRMEAQIRGANPDAHRIITGD